MTDAKEIDRVRAMATPCTPQRRCQYHPIYRSCSQCGLGMWRGQVRVCAASQQCDDCGKDRR